MRVSRLVLRIIHEPGGFVYYFVYNAPTAPALTRDIAWLLQQGYTVAGSELSESAVQQLFAELGVAPSVTNAGALKRYAAPGLDVFVGDIFALNAAQLGSIAATYDRAALISLPPPMRERYAQCGCCRATLSRAEPRRVCIAPPAYRRKYHICKFPLLICGEAAYSPRCY